MRRFLLATVATVAMSTSASAAIISSLGTDPTSATGTFSHSLAGITTPFSDQYTFNLTVGTFFTIAGVQNVYAQTSDFITGFGAAVYNYGANGVFDGTAPGHGDDVAVIIGGAPVPCQFNPNCQVIAGSAFLAGAANYYVDISGTGGGTSGYQGGVAVSVPGPVVGAGLPSLLMAVAGFFGWRRRQRQVLAA
jgi:hypothetical protein